MVFTDAFQSFQGTLGMGARLCPRAEPETKGIIERNNGYLETSFLPAADSTTPRTSTGS